MEWIGNLGEEKDKVILANGTEVEVDRLYTRILWFEQEIEVLVWLVPNGEIKLGTGSLRDCKLEVDFANRIVRITHGE